jgi:hypothetical protein
MKAAQMGVTEVAINLSFYIIDVKKDSAAYILPTALNASDFAKDRFNTALYHSPYLRSLFTDTNTVGLKQAGGVSLYIRGSRGDNNLKSFPCSTLLLDEVEEFDQKQVSLALERLSGRKEKFVWALSTPKVPNRGIHQMYLQGTQEHFHFKCPHCSRRTELIYPECLVICGESVSDKDCERSYLKCRECGHKLEQEAKPEFLHIDNCEWVPTVPDAHDHRSFYINQLYSYTISPKELAQAFFRGQIDEAAEVEFHNSKLGLPYVPKDGQVNTIHIQDAKERDCYSKASPESIPKHGENRLVCMGIDQGKINHVVIVEYLISDHGHNDINADTTAKVLWEGTFPGQEFELLDPLMSEWQVLNCVIDADPQINDARRFARRFPGFVYLCRYRRGVTGKEQQVSEEDTGAPIVTVDRTNWLSATLGRFFSGRILLPRDLSYEFERHMQNLARTYERDELNNPRAVYVNNGPDHFAHALNYAEIALPLAYGVTSGHSF